MDMQSHRSDLVPVELDGRPVGSCAVDLQESGVWVWIWEMPDGAAQMGTAESERAAGMGLAEAIADWYEGLQ